MFIVYRMWYTLPVQKKPGSPRSRDVQSQRPENQGKRVPAIFYRTGAGGEPVRIWLKELSEDDRKRIGEDIKVLLHGFIKKTQKTPQEDLELARSNKSKHQLGLK